MLSQQQVEFIIENYPIKGKKFCAQALNVSETAVANKAARLKLKRNKNAKYNRPLDIPIGSRYCGKCKQIKDESLFLDENCRNRECKLCHNDKQQKYYKKHNKKLKQQQKIKFRKNPKQSIITNIKSRAKRENIPFNLDISDINIPKFCPALGIPIEFGADGPNSVSVDRLIPSKGYVKGNIAIISKKANTIKNNGTLDEILKIADWMKSQGL